MVIQSELDDIPPIATTKQKESSVMLHIKANQRGLAEKAYREEFSKRRRALRLCLDTWKQASFEEVMAATTFDEALAAYEAAPPDMRALYWSDDQECADDSQDYEKPQHCAVRKLVEFAATPKELWQAYTREGKYLWRMFTGDHGSYDAMKKFEEERIDNYTKRLTTLSKPFANRLEEATTKESIRNFMRESEFPYLLPEVRIAAYDKLRSLFVAPPRKMWRKEMREEADKYGEEGVAKVSHGELTTAMPETLVTTKDESVRGNT